MSQSGQLIGSLMLLDVIPPTPTPPGVGPTAYPQGSNGFAAYLVGGFIGLGVLILAMILLSRKPRRADPDRRRT